MTTWTVLLTFQHPAWDEKDGIEYRGIEAPNKREAIRRVRRQAADDGHAVSGRGLYWFKAVEAEPGNPTPD